MQPEYRHDRSSLLFAGVLLILAIGLVAGPLQSEPLSKPEQLIAQLKSETGVLPPVLAVHPVSAMYNREAIIPPQCYTRTEGTFNPCYVCHQNARAGGENTMNDGPLQREYSFSEIGVTNHWKNLFEDRTAAVASISDAQILDWIDDDNYSALAGRLQAAGFRGWIPDLKNLQEAAQAFDQQGLARDDSAWVAFNYKPLPSTFWPTNGSTDDVMIRLPAAYRQRQDGTESRAVYLANLSIAEALIKGLPRIETPDIDEHEAGEDINGDGQLGIVRELDSFTHWFGAARAFHIAPSFYPEGTEFLHTVRYVGVDQRGGIAPSRRMKEVRYMRKAFTITLDAAREAYLQEGYHKDEGLLPLYTNRGDQGLDNGMGWLVQGFIEGVDGQLRVATFEENMFCMGCHSSIGSTIDKTFSFPRKVDGRAGWGYIDLRRMRDTPNRGEQDGEILTYFRRAGGGDEFRSNEELLERWFAADGHTVEAEKVRAAPDVYTLVTPSRERALELNKAYRTIVAEQDFIHGRDATVTPPANVYDQVGPDAPTLPSSLNHLWSITLDWQ
jgi:hypothetical protein